MMTILFANFHSYILWLNIFSSILPIFWLGSFLIVEFWEFIYILNQSPLSYTWFANILSAYRCVFFPLKSVFQRYFNFDEGQFILFICEFFFGDLSKNFFVAPGHEDSPILSSKIL